MNTVRTVRRGTRPKLMMASGVALGAAVTLVLAGCSSGEDVGPKTADCPDGVITLSVLRAENNVPNDAELNDYSNSVKGCVKFKTQDVPFSQLADKISVLAPTGNAPDIVGYDSPNTTDYASKGILLPLDKYLPAGWKEDVLPATLKEQSYQGKVYSMGVQQDVLTIYYNKDLTDAAGITVPTTIDKAWTWAQARDAMAKCQKGTPGTPDIYGLAPTQLGDGTPGTVYGDLVMMRSAGDPKAPQDSSAYKTFYALSPDGKSADGWLNTPEAVDAAKFYQSLFNGPTAVSSKTGRPNAFIDGKACFDIYVGEQALNLKKANVPFKWGNAPMPYIKTPIVQTGALTVGVMAKSKHADAAAKAVAAMSTAPAVTKYNQDAIRMPTLQSVYNSLPMFHEPPFDMEYNELLQWGQPRPVTSSFSQYNDIVAKALKDIAYGSDPQQRLNQAVSQLQPILSSGR
ncbi:ABC transporter substrate-binding protein [Amycolatopsis sp. GM8]|uniref:ABC transporter substrate-binding protein n=1 Tax=Amycolatopsis sp. GM8 TaxID=2896530 RepID=UPI001F21E5C1|nr:extracellular solute-binding protein [Amycolatopsis sp. GM8]